MKLDTTFLRSKVARRIFKLFILCALVPIVALATLSFNYVTKELNEQSQRRLHQASKAMGLAIFERLLFLEAEMKIASNFIAGSRGTLHRASEGFGEHLKARFKSLAVINDAGKYIPLFGPIQTPRELTSAEKQHMSSGKTLILSLFDPDLQLRILMMRALDSQHPRRGILLGEINDTYLWGTSDENTLPPMTEFCILDQSSNVLFCSLPGLVSLPEQVALKMTRSASGQFEWVHQENDYLASYWSIFLQAGFFTPKWTLVLNESKADVLAPMANFKKIFSLVVLMSIWVVLLLSISQIRRSLVPLEKLQIGTWHIAMRDFDSRVEIKSGDEFEELASSFNTMASRLGRQFNALATMSEIDRAILSVLDSKKIVDTVLTRLGDVFPCDCVSVTLLDSNATNAARTYMWDGSTGSGKRTEAVALTPEEVQKLRDNPEGLLIALEENVPHYLAPLARRGIKAFWVLPIFLKQKLSGIITLGYLDPPEHNQEDLVQARQLVDQVAVALSNTRLIEELDQLNWGTLAALGRAIDAKSPWTAGHCERVTELALKIGRTIGLTRKELDVLHRGALLHDLGKIGIPTAILNKPAKLTDEEFSLICEHPRRGAHILEPIAAYVEVIPIVLQHHERFDSKGYPDGLPGHAISLGARIFSVADAYDAMTSNRPYRAGLDRRQAIQIIMEEGGSGFDPEVVQAFLQVMAAMEEELS